MDLLKRPYLEMMWIENEKGINSQSEKDPEETQRFGTVLAL